MSRRRSRQNTYSHGLSKDGAESGPVISERGVPTQAPTLGMAPDSDESAVMDYLNSLESPNSLRAARQALNRVLRLLDEDEETTLEGAAWNRLSRLHMQVIRRSLLAEEYSVATANLTLSVTRGVAKACWNAEQLTAEEYRQITEVKGIADEVRIPGRILTGEELSRLFQSCRDDSDAANPTGPRDAAILGMLCAGMRREEVAHLNYEDVINSSKGEIRLTGSSEGKGRTVWLPSGASVGLCEWLEIRGHMDGPLWSRIRKGGHLVLPPTGLSGQSVFKLCNRRGKRAGLARTLTPVDLRRTFVTSLLEAGADVSTVQRLVGHASPATTSRYAPKPTAEGSDAARLFDVDY